MTESQYIQEVRRLIGTLKKADGRYKEEEDNARKIYESECNDANMELKTMNEKSEINLEAAKETFKNIPSHELLNDLDFRIHKKTIEDTTNLDSIVGVEPTNELKKNALIAIETSQKINEQVKELRRLIIGQQEMRKWRNTFLIILGIFAAILIFKVAELIERQRQIESYYAKGIAAYEAMNWENAHVNFKKALFINKNFKNALPLLKECYSQLRLLNQNRPKITVLGTMEFVWIPGGCFDMGSPTSEAGHCINEEPVHEVCVDGFWIGKTEVTNREYWEWKPYHNSGEKDGLFLNYDNQPVVKVTYQEAKEFASWLTENNKEGYNFRLPTEAEWEYAARADTETSRFWGNDPNKACLYANVADNKYDPSDQRMHGCDDGYKVVAPVGSFRPNNFGLYDMLGNVWEWCEDSYKIDAYREHSLINPIIKGKLGGIIRGASWSMIPEYVRSAKRIFVEDANQNLLIDVGFRLVMTE